MAAPAASRSAAVSRCPTSGNRCSSIMGTSSEGFASPAGGDKGSTKTGMTSEDLARDGIREMATAAFERVDDDSVQPHTQGHCTNRNRPIIGWPAHPWSILVREPDRDCGKPWQFRRIILRPDVPTDPDLNM